MNNPLQLAMVNFKKGSYIIVEGRHNADFFYILLDGKVRVSKEVKVVAEEGGNILGPGDFFGVVSTMSSHSYIETAQAISDISLLSVHREQYDLLIKKNASVAMKIIQGFSKKMRYLDKALAQLTLKSSATEEISHLFHVAEYYARQSQYNQAFYAYYQYVANCPTGENIKIAKERMAKIQPYANTVYLNASGEEFTRTYPKNTMIFSECQPGQELYIIQKGSVKITKIINSNEVLLAVLKSGDIFGEMSLLENKPRSASAIAHEDAVLLAVNKANFQRMVSTQPQMITRLTTLLADRIWLIYKQLANTTLSKPIARLYDALHTQLEKARVNTESTEAYTFDFGTNELLKLVGFKTNEGGGIIDQLFSNKKIKLIENRIHVSDIVEIKRQVEYYRKMEKIEQSRREGSMKKF